MNPQYLILYLKFLIYEFYLSSKISEKFFRIRQFGLINIINKLLFDKTIFPKDKYIQDYIKKNLSKWENINFFGNEKKIIVTGFVHLPIYYMMNALIGKFLEEKYNSKSLCVLEEGDYFGESIFRSFNYENFKYLKKGSFFHRFKLFGDSIKIISKYKNIEEFLKFKVNNVYLGKTVYDHYLRNTGNCSTKINNFKIYYLLSKALNFDSKIKKILDENRFEFGVQSEHQFIPGAISFQNCLERNIKIFAKNKGPKWITISKFNNEKEMYTPRDKIDYNFYNKFYSEYRDKASKLGKSIIINRLEGKDDFSLKSWGIVDFPKEKISFDQLRTTYNWKKNVPVVCVFGHLFVDGNYSEGWRLHKDNLTWLQSTLEIIKDIKDINWIIKPHPLEKDYNTSTSTYNEFKKYEKKYNHIKFADKRISNSTLSNNIIAAVSSHGTAPLEYASLGIPSIVCGNTRYSKLGFLNEAKTNEEYEKLLRNVMNLKKLDQEQIDKANVFTYLAGKLVLIDSEIIPEVGKNQDRIDGYSKNKFWEESIKKINEFSYNDSYLKKMFFLQIDNEVDNIINYEFLKKEMK